MRVRALSPTGDYTFGSGGQNYLVNSATAVAQCVQTALLLFLGEWFLDTSAGVAWLTEVIGFGTESTRDVVVRNAILGVQGVNSIVNYNSELVGTTFNVGPITVDTDYGLITIPLVGIPVNPGNGWGVGPIGDGGYGN
jgi:hypothetical protein